MAKAPQAPHLLMPKATAVWLLDNTVLPFTTIAECTGLTELEIISLANEDIGMGLVGRDPVTHKEFTKESVEQAKTDSETHLIPAKHNLPTVKVRSKGPRYTPVNKRADKPNAIAYILKHYPDITDAQIVKLIGTTKNTIASIRDRTHADTGNHQPRHPTDLGLCSYKEFDAVYDKALRDAGKDPEAVKAEEKAQQAAQNETEHSSDEDTQGQAGGFDFSNFLSSSS